jgi:hypothetical protein
MLNLAFKERVNMLNFVVLNVVMLGNDMVSVVAPIFYLFLILNIYF